MAANLFTLDELVSYLQVDEFDTLTAQLARDLVTTEIRLYAGPLIFDAMSDTDRAAFKAVALAAAKRVLLNPSGLRSAQIDDYSETYATETFGDAELTDAEKARIDAIVGRGAGNFTIRPYGQPDCTRPAVLADYCWSDGGDPACRP